MGKETFNEPASFDRAMRLLNPEKLEQLLLKHYGLSRSDAAGITYLVLGWLAAGVEIEESIRPEGSEVTEPVECGFNGNKNKIH